MRAHKAKGCAAGTTLMMVLGLLGLLGGLPASGNDRADQAVSTEVVQGKVDELDKFGRWMVLRVDTADRSATGLKIYWNRATKIFGHKGEARTASNFALGQRLRVKCTTRELVSVTGGKVEVKGVVGDAVEIVILDLAGPAVEAIPKVDEIVSDYLTLTLCLASVDVVGSAPELRKAALALMEKHGLGDSKWRVDVRLEGVEAILTSFGFALRFGSAWVEPLLLFIDSRGDFPPIRVRNGSISLQERPFGLRVFERTEVEVNGTVYFYSEGEWIKL